MIVQTEIIEKRKSETFLVYAFVFWGMMSFFYHFQYLSGGGLGPFLNSIHFSLFGSIFLILLLLLKGKTTRITTGVNKNIASVFGLCAFIYVLSGIQGVTFWGFLGDILTMLLILLFILLRDDLKLRIFDAFINAMAILMFLSMIEYVIYLVTGMKYVVFDNLLYLEERPLTQTLFNLVWPDSPYNMIVPRYYRFQSLADEPGGVGTTMGLMLFATSGNPEYKRHYIIFWLAGIISFSLAFYVLALSNLIVLARENRDFRFLFVFILIAGVAYYFLGDAFNELIVNRISGNEVSDIDNRTSEVLDKKLIAAMRDGSILIGHEFVAESGGKGVLYNRGLIGMLALIVAYSSSYMAKVRSLKLRNVSFAVFFLIVFWISFYQRAAILMFQYVIPFFCLPIMLKYKENLLIEARWNQRK